MVRMRGFFIAASLLFCLVASPGMAGVAVGQSTISAYDFFPKRASAQSSWFMGDLTLASATLPGASTGVGYAFDLSPLLSSEPDVYGVGGLSTWEIVGGELPAGLSMSSRGLVSGIPTVANGTGVNFEVKATYNGKSIVGSYTLVVS